MANPLILVLALSGAACVFAGPASFQPYDPSRRLPGPVVDPVIDGIRVPKPPSNDFPRSMVAAKPWSLGSAGVRALPSIIFASAIAAMAILRRLQILAEAERP